MFNSAQLNRIELAISKLRDDLRLKEQYNRIEAQQDRIESQLGEILELASDSLKEEAASLAGEFGKQKDKLSSANTDNTPKT